VRGESVSNKGSATGIMGHRVNHSCVKSCCHTPVIIK